jgi:hypothetical protein
VHWWLVFVAGCGRIGFDPSAPASCTSPQRPNGVVASSGSLAIDPSATVGTSAVSLPLDATMLLASLAEAEPSPLYGAVACELQPDGVRCSRRAAGTDYAGSTGQIDVAFAAAQLDAMTVQRGLTTSGTLAAPVLVDLTPVDPTATFVVLGGITQDGGMGWGQNEFMRAELVDDHTLALAGYTGSSMVAWQVISLPGAEVERGSAMLAPPDTEVVVPLDRAATGLVPLVTYAASTSSQAAVTMLRAEIRDSAVVLHRDAGDRSMLAISYELVWMPFATRAHTTTFSAGETTKTELLDLPDFPFAFASGDAILGPGTGSTTYNGAETDLLGEASVTLNAQPGMVTLTRASAEAEATISWVSVHTAYDRCN